jgi:hypothetical protein
VRILGPSCGGKDGRGVEGGGRKARYIELEARDRVMLLKKIVEGCRGSLKLKLQKRMKKSGGEWTDIEARR